jgi:hypothetical protein
MQSYVLLSLPFYKKANLENLFLSLVRKFSRKRPKQGCQILSVHQIKLKYTKISTKIPNGPKIYQNGNKDTKM